MDNQVHVFPRLWMVDGLGCTRRDDLPGQTLCGTRCGSRSGILRAHAEPGVGFHHALHISLHVHSGSLPVFGSLGPIALARAGTATRAVTWKGSGRLILGSAVCIVGILAALTWHQTKIYDNRETLWRDTLAKKPTSWIAHTNLGGALARQGKLTEAIEQYERAL